MKGRLDTKTYSSYNQVSGGQDIYNCDSQSSTLTTAFDEVARLTTLSANISSVMLSSSCFGPFLKEVSHIIWRGALEKEGTLL